VANKDEMIDLLYKEFCEYSFRYHIASSLFTRLYLLVLILEFVFKVSIPVRIPVDEVFYSKKQAKSLQS